MSGRLRQEDGMTLIEVLVAAIVLVIGIGGTVTVLISSGKAGATAERHDVGVSLAQQEIEEVRSMAFDDVALSATPPYPASSGPSHPSERVDNGKFHAPGSVDEDLVGGGTIRGYDDKTTDSSLTIGSGPGAVTASVYRFVSWRDESCSATGVGNLGLLENIVNSNTSLAELSVQVNTSLATLTVGAGVGSLQGLINNINGAQSTLSGILNVLLGQVLTAANGITGKGDTLEPVATQLQAALAGLSGAGGSLTQLSSTLTGLSSLDLCNIDLSGLAQLQQVQTALTALQAELAAINSANLSGVSNLFGSVIGVNCGPLNLLCLLGNSVGNLLVSVNNQLNPLVTPLVNAMNAVTNSTNLDTLNQLLPGLQSVVSSLSSSTDSNNAQNQRNSKRVVVAVVLDPAGDVGPSQPIWMSTVVTDPNAGL